MQVRKNVEGRYGKQNAREKAQGITLLYAVFIKPKETDDSSCRKMPVEETFSFTRLWLN